MHQQKSKKIFIYFFLLFLFGSLNNIELSKIQIFKLKEIKLTGLDKENNLQLLNKIKSLRLENIFFLDLKEIKNIIELNPLVENYKVSRIYPSSLDIKTTKTEFLAKINREGKIFIIGSNGKLSENYSLQKDLPFVFGTPKIQEFLNFKNIIDQSKFPFKEIKNLYFYPSKRWDVELKNNMLIKLSKNKPKMSLDTAFNFLKSQNIQNPKIIDVRMSKQIIIND